VKWLLVAASALTLAVTLAAQDPLNEARDLYASAAYEEALGALSRLDKTVPVTEQVDQYRAFCLVALGRTAEAQAVAEALVTRNPLIEIDGDASPRIVAIFTAARQQLLPGLIREKYRTARASFDQKDFASAQPQLETVKRMLEESARLGASDAAAGDLGVLVEGFLNLIETTAALAKPAMREAPPDTITAAPAAPPPSAESPRPETAAAPRIYTTGASDVVAPIALRQDVPPIPVELRQVMRTGPNAGTVEVLIDEQGNVEDVIMRETIQPVYDRLVMNAARKWKYRPALKGQAPVKFVKRIAILVEIARPAGSGPD
jgi:tetratricopeptide (TPR) repeat protein